MNKFSKLFISFFMVITLLCLSVVPCFAAVNEKDAPVGSTIEYTVSIADCVQNLTGIQMEVLFDQSKLELKEVNTDNLPGSTVNDNQNKDGAIRIVNSFINGQEGLECKEKTALVTATFEVIAEGDSQIKYYIPYLYDYDEVSIYKYTITQTIKVDGEVVVDNVPPVLASDEDFAAISSFDKGDFPNYPAGTGSGIKVLPEDINTNDNSDSADEAGNDNSLTIYIVIACVIAAAVVVLIVLKAKSKK